MALIRVHWSTKRCDKAEQLSSELSVVSLSLSLTLPTMRACYLIVLPLLIAVLAYGAMSIASRMNYGFQFTPEQLQQYNRITNCQSQYIAPASSTSTYFAPTEDIEVDLEDDIAFMGVSDLQAKNLARPPTFYGNLVAWFQKNDNKIVPRRTSKDMKGDEVPYNRFNPVGLSVLRYQGFADKPGLWVFTINYDFFGGSKPGVIINQYHFKNNLAHYFEQEAFVRHSLIENPNDVAAISPTEFYLTNHQTGALSHTPFGMVADILGLYSGNLIYCNADKNQCKVVLDGLAFANSVYLNHDHSQLYMTETFERRFSVYNRDILTNEIYLNETIVLDGLLDNINVDMNNNVWIAATMDAFATFRSIIDPTKQFKSAPNIVYRLVPKSGLPGEKPTPWSHPTLTSNNFWIEIMYADNGSSISPLSVAAPTRLGQVILGSLIAEEILRCDIPDSY
jgi:hypothetical protein